MDIFGTLINGIVYKKEGKEYIVKKAIVPGNKCLIEDVVKEIPVTCVWNNAFKNTNVQEIVFPDKIGFIGEGAFSGTKLKEVKIPGGVNDIWNESFANCKDLERVELSENCKSIYECAFAGCSNLKKINLKKVQVIHGSAFADCISLRGAFLWSACQISSFSFARCTNLTTVIIGDDCTEINGEAFKDCTNLETVILPKKITDFGNSGLRVAEADRLVKRKNPFAGCSNLKRILYNGTPDEINVDVRDYLVNECGLKIYYYSSQHQKDTWCCENDTIGIY